MLFLKPLPSRFGPESDPTSRLSFARLNLVKKEDASLQRNATGKSPDGLYLIIDEEEKKIRQDPVGTGSAIFEEGVWGHQVGRGEGCQLDESLRSLDSSAFVSVMSTKVMTAPSITLSMRR